MIFFDYFVLILAVAFLWRGWRLPACRFLPKEKRALEMFIVALILYYPVSGLMVVGMYLSLIARPIAVILGILSFRLLCLEVPRTTEPAE
jgi:hypothetical protein